MIIKIKSLSEFKFEYLPEYSPPFNLRVPLGCLSQIPNRPDTTFYSCGWNTTPIHSCHFLLMQQTVPRYEQLPPIKYGFKIVKTSLNHIFTIEELFSYHFRKLFSIHFHIIDILCKSNLNLYGPPSFFLPIENLVLNDSNNATF